MSTLGARNRFLGLEGGGGDKSPLPLLGETVTLEMFRLETPRLLNTSCHTIPLPFLLLTLQQLLLIVIMYRSSFHLKIMYCNHSISVIVTTEVIGRYVYGVCSIYKTSQNLSYKLGLNSWVIATFTLMCHVLIISHWTHELRVNFIKVYATIISSKIRVYLITFVSL